MRLRVAAAGLLLALAVTAGNPKVHNLEAKGSRGWIKFWGNGEVWLEGRGSLLIKNLSKITLQNQGTWKTEDKKADGVQYFFYEGKVYLVGRGIHVEMRGWDLAITAKGQGEAHLQGDGTFTLDGETGEWDKRARENKYKKLHFEK